MRRTGLATPALVAAAACAAGAALRIALAHSAALWGDELHSLALWRRGAAEILASYDRFGSGLALPLLQHAAADLLGPTLWAARLPALLGGIAGLALAYPVGRRLAGPGAAALATLGLALSPVHLFYSHFARSYTLVVVLALVLADGMARLLERPASRLGWGETALAAALLPFVHLASVAVVAAGAIGAGLAAALGARGALRPLALSLAAGTLLCLLFYLPAWESVLEFVRAKASRGEHVPYGALDVAALFMGSRAGGAVALAALPAAALGWLASRGAAGALVAALALLPAAAVALVDPISNAVAFSRYTIGSLFFALLLLAWGALRLGDLLGGARGAGAAGVLAALLLAFAARGPLTASLTGRDGPFANTYLGLHPVPAFDVSLPSERDFYRGLAARSDVAEVVEVPAARLGGALLYRGYALEHGKRVLLGHVGWVPPGQRGAPYVRVEEMAGCRGRRILVVHRELEAEVGAYLSLVASALPEQDVAIAGPLVRLLPSERALPPGALQALERQLGAPVHTGERILAFDVACEGSG